MPSCSVNNANLDKINFDRFYKIYCCAAIHGRIWRNNVPHERRRIMLSCTEISFVISFFNFEKFGVKPGFPFLTHTVYMHYNLFFPRICFKCLENKTLQLYSLGCILNYCHVDGWHLSFSHSLKVSLLHAQEFVHDGATVHLTRRCVEGVGIRPGLEINSLNNLFSFFAVEIINQRTGFHKHWFGRHFNLIWSS